MRSRWRWFGDVVRAPGAATSNRYAEWRSRRRICERGDSVLIGRPLPAHRQRMPSPPHASTISAVGAFCFTASIPASRAARVVYISLVPRICPFAARSVRARGHAFVTAPVIRRSGMRGTRGRRRRLFGTAEGGTVAGVKGPLRELVEDWWVVAGFSSRDAWDSAGRERHRVTTGVAPAPRANRRSGGARLIV